MAELLLLGVRDAEEEEEDADDVTWVLPELEGALECDGDAEGRWADGEEVGLSLCEEGESLGLLWWEEWLL